MILGWSYLVGGFNPRDHQVYHSLYSFRIANRKGVKYHQPNFGNGVKVLKSIQLLGACQVFEINRVGSNGCPKAGFLLLPHQYPSRVIDFEARDLCVLPGGRITTKTWTTCHSWTILYQMSYLLSIKQKLDFWCLEYFWLQFRKYPALGQKDLNLVPYHPPTENSKCPSSEMHQTRWPRPYFELLVK